MLCCAWPFLFFGGALEGYDANDLRRLRHVIRRADVVCGQKAADPFHWLDDVTSFSERARLHALADEIHTRGGTPTLLSMERACAAALAF